MRNEAIYDKLNYSGFLKKNSEVAYVYPDYSDLTKIGADKVYFSGDFPAILFVDIHSFNDVNELIRIADIHHRAWNYRKVILLFAVSDTEIRIYNCYAKPSYRNEESADNQLKPAEIFKCRYFDEDEDTKNLSILLEIFSRIGIDNGLLWRAQSDLHKKIDLKNRIDRYLMECLKKTTENLEKLGLNKDIIHTLLMRSLFILFLEDKGAANEAGLYSKIKPGCTSYFDILDDKEAAFILFEELQLHFNGNITPILPNEKNEITDEHLRIIKRCFMDGDISGNESLFNNWRLFNFEIIQIELLSEIYEMFLGELKHNRGQFYTPYNLVEFVLCDKLPTDTSNYNVKILDPACGSGVFLVESYKRLIKRWKHCHPQATISFEELKRILLDNIYGIEIDATAIKVAAFSLYLTLIDELNPKTLWIDKGYQLPYLIYDPSDKSILSEGKNLWRQDTIGEVDPDFFPKVDLVIGNPPFGTNNLPLSIKNYCLKYNLAKDYVLPFIHKSTDFCPDGEIALIFNSKVLTNTEKNYPKFRNWLFNNNYVTKICNLSILRRTPKNFGGQLFSSAVSPVSIVYFTPKIPVTKSDTVEYWAPKTYLNSSIVDGIVIDNSDIKYLPRPECQNPHSHIWKVALWGNFNSFNLIKRLQHTTLGTYIAHNKNWISGRGLNADKDHPDFIPAQIITTGLIERYVTPEGAVQPNHKPYRKPAEKLFHPPYIIFKEGLHETEIACSLFFGEAYCTTGAFPINTLSDDIDQKKFLVAYLNSDLVKFFLFLTASSWGIERERILLNEVMGVPSPFFYLDSNSTVISNIVSAYDKIADLKRNNVIDNNNTEQQIKKQEQIIFHELAQSFSLSDRDLKIINDVIKYNLSIFKEGPKSISFKSTVVTENSLYANTLCDDLNSFLASTDTKSTATVFDINEKDPLNLVIIHFGTDEKGPIIKDSISLREQLKMLEKFTYGKKASNIFVQKHIRYYDADKVYLIKPNQKRFWTQTEAMEDASSLIAEIINMGKP